MCSHAVHPIKGAIYMAHQSCDVLNFLFKKMCHLTTSPCRLDSACIEMCHFTIYTVANLYAAPKGRIQRGFRESGPPVCNQLF